HHQPRARTRQPPARRRPRHRADGRRPPPARARHGTRRHRTGARLLHLGRRLCVRHQHRAAHRPRRPCRALPRRDCPRQPTPRHARPAIPLPPPRRRPRLGGGDPHARQLPRARLRADGSRRLDQKPRPPVGRPFLQGPRPPLSRNRDGPPRQNPTLVPRPRKRVSLKERGRACPRRVTSPKRSRLRLWPKWPHIAEPPAIASCASSLVNGSMKSPENTRSPPPPSTTGTTSPARPFGAV